MEESWAIRINQAARLDIGTDRGEAGASRESVTEMLSEACGRVIAIARKIGAAIVAVEDGLGKLRSTGPARDLIRTLNFWARSRRTGGPRKSVRKNAILADHIRKQRFVKLASRATDICAFV